MLKVHNTPSGKKEEFISREKNKVGMYVCGITPYDECHLGHARCYVAFDVIHRYLVYKGYKVRYIQNFTDIDDKIINRAREKMKSGGDVKAGAREITEEYIGEYFKYMDLLNVKRADEYPRVTGQIKEIIKLVRGLVDKGYAYVIDQSVYFEVAKFEDYGKLSHRSAEELMPGARVEVDKRKKSPLDFAVWKAAREDEPSWDSPWGKGRPGWHIECSAMSNKYLGSTLDIHGGGRDLIFPHHENEIAQSEAYTGKQFVKYWIHNGFVTMDKEKMSKSTGNFFTLREIFEKYDPMVVRFFLLSAHYRSPIDFSDKGLEMAKNALFRLRIFKNNLAFFIQALKLAKEGSGKTGQRGEMDRVAIDKLRNEISALKVEFLNAMDDDFNTSKALGHLNDIISSANIFISNVPPGVSNTGVIIKLVEEIEKTFEELAGDILGLDIQAGLGIKELKGLIEKREGARAKKDWAAADKIRKELQDKGITIEDTPFGPRPVVKK